MLGNRKLRHCIGVWRYLHKCDQIIVLTEDQNSRHFHFPFLQFNSHLLLDDWRYPRCLTSFCCIVLIRIQHRRTNGIDVGMRDRVSMEILLDSRDRRSGYRGSSAVMGSGEEDVRSRTWYCWCSKINSHAWDFYLVQRFCAFVFIKSVYDAYRITVYISRYVLHYLCTFYWIIYIALTDVTCCVRLQCACVLQLHSSCVYMRCMYVSYILSTQWGPYSPVAPGK